MLLIFKTHVLIINCICYDFEPFSVPKNSFYGFFLNPKRQHWLWISKCASILTYWILIAYAVECLYNIGRKTRLHETEYETLTEKLNDAILKRHIYTTVWSFATNPCVVLFQHFNKIEISWKSPLTLSYSSESSPALLAVLRHH